MAEVFAAIRRDDTAGVIEQFRSLPAASQYRKLYELTSRHVAPGSRVLDWGCGRGHFSYFLVRRGFSVTAYSLEHPPEIFDALSSSERSRLTFVRGSPEEVRRLPFGDGEFAAVFSVGVLEHVRETGGDELSSLRELRRALAGDGVFLCYHLPNRYSYIEAASRRLGARRRTGDFHRHRFTGRDIRRLCGEAGFEVVDSARYGVLPRNSLNRLPSRWRDARFVTAALDRSDAVLERLFSLVAQNYYFVARPGPEAQMADEVREFGDLVPGATYVLRPGGYAVIFDADGRLAVVETEEGLHLPGGGQEAGETPEAAMVREVAEECGLRVALESAIGIADEFVFAKSEGTHYRKRCSFFMAIVIGTGEPQEEGHALRWMDPRAAVESLHHGIQRWAVEEALRSSSSRRDGAFAKGSEAS